jgi:hypothetical protein
MMIGPRRTVILVALVESRASGGGGGSDYADTSKVKVITNTPGRRRGQGHRRQPHHRRLAHDPG